MAGGGSGEGRVWGTKGAVSLLQCSFKAHTAFSVRTALQPGLPSGHPARLPVDSARGGQPGGQERAGRGGGARGADMRCPAPCVCPPVSTSFRLVNRPAQFGPGLIRMSLPRPQGSGSFTVTQSGQNHSRRSTGLTESGGVATPDTARSPQG